MTTQPPPEAMHRTVTRMYNLLNGTSKTFEEVRASALEKIRHIGITTENGKLIWDGKEFHVPAPDGLGPWMTFCNDKELIDALTA